MKLILPLAAIIVLLQSCITSQYVVKDESINKITIPFRADTIIILDERMHKRPMNWDLPAVSTKPFSVIGDPELTLEQKNILATLIKQSENINGKPARITLRLLEGTCEIYADWKQATEKAAVAVELEIAESGTNNIQRIQTEAFFNNGTVNALEKSVMRTYNTVLKNATHHALTISAAPTAPK